MKDAKSIIKRIAVWFFGAIGLMLVYYAVFALFFSTDVEKQLSRENRLLSSSEPQVRVQSEILEKELDFLEMRDGKIYKSLFKTDAPDVSQLLEDEPHSLISDVEDSWRAIFAAMNRKDFKMPPLITPLDSLDYTKVGASVGSKMNPFYKIQMNHTGVDLVAPEGTPVYSTAAGYVTKVSSSSGGKGLVVEITHGNGFVSRYCHLSKSLVPVGRYVKAHRQIGLAGSSGRTFSTHLHYEIEKDGKVCDPVSFFLGSVTPDEYLNMLIMSGSSGQSLD